MKHLAVAVMLGACPMEAWATTMPYSKEDICSRAGIVLIGTVTDVKSDWVGIPHHSIIVSQVTFDIERLIHGPSRSNITIEVPSGVVDGSWFIANSTPIMRRDERYLLLLYPRIDRPAVVLGQGAGAVRLDPTVPLPDTGELQAMYTKTCDGSIRVAPGLDPNPVGARPILDLRDLQAIETKIDIDRSAK